MDGDVVTAGGIVIPAGAMTWRFSRGTGPGGQGVNTTDSRVELVVDLAGLVTSPEIADRLGVSPVTVRRHVGLLLQKLGAESREAAVEMLRIYGRR